MYLEIRHKRGWDTAIVTRNDVIYIIVICYWEVLNSETYTYDTLSTEQKQNSFLAQITAHK